MEEIRSLPIFGRDRISLDLMINHQKQWDFLVKSVELGRLPHALLFCGQQGLAKKDFCLKFAKFFIGTINPPDFVLVEPAGRPAFVRASAGKKIQISQIRDLIEKLSFKPYMADSKIAVINKAHLMTFEAQNCFLKFLEEPKDKTFLILITEYPAMLLPTILSRVQKIRFYSSLRTKQDSGVGASPQFISDLAMLIQSDLATRFQYAKDISRENLEEVLDDWLKYFRRIFISRLSRKRGAKLPRCKRGSLAPREELSFPAYSGAKLKDILNQIQLTKTLISSTNINPRLALEILLMKI